MTQSLPADVDLTADDHLIENSDNGPEEGAETPSQEPRYDGPEL